MENEKHWIVYLIIIPILYWMGWFDFLNTHFNIFNNHQISYQIMCDGSNNATLRRQDYKILPTEQMVLMNSEIGPEKTKDCTIYDKDNWNCKISNTQVQMRNGNFFPTLGRDKEGFSWREIFYLHYFYLKTFKSQSDINKYCPII